MTPAIISALDRRVDEPEMMDDLSIGGERLYQGLRDLEYVNRLLGGHRALRLALTSLVREREGGSLHVLDLASGGGSHAEHLVRWGAAMGVALHVTAVDANPAAVDYACRRLDARLPPALRSMISVRHGNALQLAYSDRACDVATTSLFLHHLSDAEGVRLLAEMARLSSCGIVVNDLHRHPVAYWGVRAMAALLPTSEMFMMDGPRSVRRAFLPDELLRMAHDAGLSDARLERRWAFRLILSTIRPA